MIEKKRPWEHTYHIGICFISPWYVFWKRICRTRGLLMSENAILSGPEVSAGFAEVMYCLIGLFCKRPIRTPGLWIPNFYVPLGMWICPFIDVTNCSPISLRHAFATSARLWRIQFRLRPLPTTGWTRRNGASRHLFEISRTSHNIFTRWMRRYVLSWFVIIMLTSNMDFYRECLTMTAPINTPSFHTYYDATFSASTARQPLVLWDILNAPVMDRSGWLCLTQSLPWLLLRYVFSLLQLLFHLLTLC